MEESEYKTPSLPSYWNSVILAGAIFGLISGIGQIVGGYVVISSGAQSNLLNFGLCLVGAFAGLTALWHYNELGDFVMTLGRGALIGFWTGVGAAIVSMVVVALWKFIDSSYGPALMETQIAIIENDPNIPDAWKQTLIDATYDPGLAMTILSSVGGVILNGVVNMLTGMLGVKIFGSTKEEF